MGSIVEAAKALAVVLETPDDYVVEDGKQFGGAYDRLKKIRRELQSIERLAIHAGVSEYTTLLMKEFRLFSNRVADALDDEDAYAVKVGFKKKFGVKRLLRKFDRITKQKLLIECIDMEKEMINVKQRFMGELSYFLTRVEHEEEEQGVVAGLLRPSFIPEKGEDYYLVGMGRDIENLISSFTNLSKRRPTIIYDMSGVGKTTMAREVFNRLKLRQVFDAYAWVTIYQMYNPTTIMQDLLNQLGISNNGRDRIEGNDINDELIRDISKVLAKKKCFVVLDDVWKFDSHLIILEDLFNNAEGDSKLIFTTRKYKVANVGYIYLQPLLSEDGFQIPRKKAIHPHRVIDPEEDPMSTNLGRQMVRSSGGYPHEIVGLSDIERNGSFASNWKSFYIWRPYLFFPCLLYMAIFGEDQEIDSKILCNMWIAEDMISQDDLLQGETLMDAAERFLEVLVSRSLLVQIHSILGGLGSCRLIELMRGDSMERLDTLFNFSSINIDLRGGQSVRIDTSPGDARMVSIHLNMDAHDSRCVKPFDKIESREVRTLSLHCVKPVWHPSLESEAESPLSDMGRHTVEVSRISDFKLLRVLNFEDCRFHRRKLPIRIGELLLLKFFSIRGCDVDELPSSVGELPLLQTLDLRTSSTLRISDSMFAKKKDPRHLYLRHLYLSNFICGSGKPLDLSGLFMLETLIMEVGMVEPTITSLAELENIRHFKLNLLWEDVDWSLIIEHMENWKKIKRLEVGMFSTGVDAASKAILSNKITDLRLSGIKLYVDNRELGQNLLSLDLFSCDRVNATVMALIGRLPKLRKLRCAVPVHRNTCFTSFKFYNTDFSELISLELSKWDMEELIIEEGSLPKLVTLRLDSCNDDFVLKPRWAFQYLHNLREVHIGNMPQFEHSCRWHQPLYEHVLIVTIEMQPQNAKSSNLKVNKSRSSS